jgi:acyl carrier protein
VWRRYASLRTGDLCASAELRFVRVAVIGARDDDRGAVNGVGDRCRFGGAGFPVRSGELPASRRDMPAGGHRVERNDRGTIASLRSPILSSSIAERDDMALPLRKPAEPGAPVADNAQALLDLLRTLVAETQRAAPPRVRLDSRLVEDLGIDSLARVELNLRCEQAFGRRSRSSRRCAWRLRPRRGTGRLRRPRSPRFSPAARTTR